MLTLAWDVDDVLNDLMRSWFEKKWLIDNPRSTVKYEDLIENPPGKIIGVAREEYIQSLDAFRLSQDYIEMEPNKDVLVWFEKYGEKARHIVLTSVPAIRADISAKWVLKNFSKWIRSFNYVPSIRDDIKVPEYDKSKVDFLTWFGKVDVFIEDNEANIREAAEQGINGLLVAKPWNNSNVSLPEVLKKITIMIETESND